jgi:hypothetical protein
LTAPGIKRDEGSTISNQDGDNNITIEEDVADDTSVAAQPTASPPQSWSSASSICSVSTRTSAKRRRLDGSPAGNDGDGDNDNDGNGDNNALSCHRAKRRRTMMIEHDQNKTDRQMMDEND